MFERATSPLQPFTLDALWQSARETWNSVCGFFAPSFQTFADSPLSRDDHGIIRPMLLGLEHFVRRALLLAALAMQSLPLAKASRAPRKADVRPPQARRLHGLRIFEPVWRKPSARSRPSFRAPAAGPAPDGPLQARYRREEEEAFKRANLARDPLERSPPPPAFGERRPQTEAGSRLPDRPAFVSGRGLAVRMVVLGRLLEAPEAAARRLRRAIDRRKALREAAAWMGPPRIAPWPRDRFARRIAGHDTLAWLWPNAEAAINLMLDAFDDELPPPPDSS